MQSPLATWRGQPIDEMSRESLIEALQWLGARYGELTSPQASHQRALGKVALLKETLRKR